jgi:hypothetical protein
MPQKRKNLFTSIYQGLACDSRTLLRGRTTESYIISVSAVAPLDHKSAYMVERGDRAYKMMPTVSNPITDEIRQSSHMNRYSTVHLRTPQYQAIFCTKRGRPSRPYKQARSSLSTI